MDGMKDMNNSILKKDTNEAKWVLVLKSSFPFVLITKLFMEQI